MPVKAKTFDYAIGLDRAGRLTAEGHAELDLDRAWTPEHLVLAGLIRCTLESLRHHADRASIDFVAGGSASARVTRRESDDRYALVEVRCELEVELDPPLPGDELGALLAKAERDCFVGASMTASPGYRWRVNGEELP